METPSPSPISTRRTAVLLVAVAFVAGALIGFAGGRVYSIYHIFNRRPESIERGILRHLDRELKLTPQQHDQIAAIIDRHHKRMVEITDGVRPQMRQELDSANREIDVLLTPEQRTKFNEMHMRMQRFRRSHHDGTPPPGL